MIDDWFDVIELPLSYDQYRALPTNPAYKYEYFNGRAVLSPKPKCYRAVLELATAATHANISESSRLELRSLRDADWAHFPKLFAGAFARVQPFCSLSDDRRMDAANGCLAKTQTGGDGPLIETACVVATHPNDSDHPIAASLVTLSRFRDEEGDDEDSKMWSQDIPHLTWIFVAPRMSRHGVGSALLNASIRGLISLGSTHLASTYLLGNESSTLWHWRNGFRVRSYEQRLRNASRF